MKDVYEKNHSASDTLGTCLFSSLKSSTPPGEGTKRGHRSPSTIPYEHNSLLAESAKGSEWPQLPSPSDDLHSPPPALIAALSLSLVTMGLLVVSSAPYGGIVGEL